MQPNHKRLIFCLFASIVLFAFTISPLANAILDNELLKNAHAMGLNYCALTVLWEVFALIVSVVSTYSKTLSAIERKEEQARQLRQERQAQRRQTLAEQESATLQ